MMLKRIGTAAGVLVLASIVTFRACGDDVARHVPAYTDDAIRAVGRLPSSAPDVAPLLGDEAAAAAPTISPGVLTWVVRVLRPYARTALRDAQELLEDDGVQNAAGLAMDVMCTSLKNVRLTGAATPDHVSRLVLTRRLDDEGLAERAWRSLQPVRDAVDKVASATSPHETAVALMREVGCPLKDIYNISQQ